MSVLVLTAWVGCVSPVDSADPNALHDVYTLADDEQFPEGMAFHAGERAFFLGSLTTGAVTRLDADGSESVLFTPDPGWMSLGMTLDGDVLAVCAVFAYGEPDTTGAIWAFDVTTGAQTASVDLGAAFAGANCNDAVFHDGALYVTDRENPNLYRADLAEQAATLWLSDPLLEPGYIGMNGVVVTAGEDLLVGKYGPAELLRIPLDDPGSLEAVTLTGDAVGSLPNGFDGIVWQGDTLVIAGNAELYRIDSDDDWRTGVVRTTVPEVRTAAVTVAEGRLYGLKGEVVPYVLGTDVDLPFEILALD